MSDEDRLRQRLREQVSGAKVVVDLDDVTARIHRREHGRVRSLAAVGVLALLAGTLGGFAAGRSGRSSGPDVVASPASSSNGTGSLAPTVAEEPGRLASMSTRLFLRTTSDGVTIRVYEIPGDKTIRSGDTVLRAYRAVQAEMSTDAAVTTAAAGWSGPSSLALGGMSPGSFGVSEHAPAQWLVVQVRSDVGRVRASFAGGGVDEMTPQHGVAVLAHLGSGRPVKVDVIDDKGRITFSETVPVPKCVVDCPSANGTATTIPAGATPGLTLPAPGSEQPADVPAAHSAVTQAFAGAFDGAASNATRVRSVEGGSALVSVFDALRHGPNATAVQSARTVVEGVVFLSPTTAAAKFHSLIAPGGTSGPYLGRAVLSPAGWQVTRTSYCELAALAGATCP